MTDWRTLPPGPQLRRIIAEHKGWHMRKIWVGSGGVEYDYIVYDEGDRYIHQCELSKEDLSDPESAEARVWLEAMESDECPRWDEHDNDAMWLIVQGEYKLWQDGGMHHAWVSAPEYNGSGPTEALAISRAWLAWTEVNPQ